jgi:hypothetical protein
MDNINKTDKKTYYKEYYKNNSEYFINRNKIKDNDEKKEYYKKYYLKNKYKKKSKEPLQTITKHVDKIVVSFD